MAPEQMTISPFDKNLDKVKANYAPLTPVSFLQRSAHVYPNLTSVIYEERCFTWKETFERCRRFASFLDQ
ncbi:acyl-CoA synthetase (AMP-forming)/AMP-acid ligase II [Bradyrhizobium sp. USDA 4463]